jgi:hypothetical protein
MTSSAKKFGFFSQKAVEFNGGSSIYLTPDGQEVETTFIADDEQGEFYTWDDKVCLGEITTRVRTGRPMKGMTARDSGTRKIVNYLPDTPEQTDRKE